MVVVSKIIINTSNVLLFSCLVVFKRRRIISIYEVDVFVKDSFARNANCAFLCLKIEIMRGILLVLADVFVFVVHIFLYVLRVKAKLVIAKVRRPEAILIFSLTSELQFQLTWMTAVSKSLI